MEELFFLSGGGMRPSEHNKGSSDIKRSRWVNQRLNHQWLTLDVLEHLGQAQHDSSMKMNLFVFIGHFRDRLRTTTNVLGDSIGAGIVEHLSRHELRSIDAEIGNSVVEENETKKSYQLISQENESENAKIPDSETKM